MFPAGLALVGAQDLADADLALLVDVRDTNIAVHQGAVMGHAFLQNSAAILNAKAKNTTSCRVSFFTEPLIC